MKRVQRQVDPEHVQNIRNVYDIAVKRGCYLPYIRMDMRVSTAQDIRNSCDTNAATVDRLRVRHF